MTKETQQATIIYTEVERTIDFYYQMQKISTHHELTVTPEVVTTARAEFTLNQVLDVSYKPFSSEAGILYLHTNQGVFPFYIHSNPQTFIDTFRSLK
jgi:sorbitol-specific phosphotransferase system component IIC